MSGRGTERLVRDLVGDLQPVRPVPRLRRVVVGVLGVWLLAAPLYRIVPGPKANLEGFLWDDLGFLALFSALVLTAGGALAAALAGGVPGRARAERVGRQVALTGLALGFVGAWIALLSPVRGAAQISPARHLICASRACILGVAPAVVAALFLSRAAPRRPWIAAGLATGGCVALGAISIHAFCGAFGGVHWLLGHWLGPMVGAALLTLPLAVLVSSRRAILRRPWPTSDSS